MQEENFLHEWHKVYFCHFILEQCQPYKVLHLNPLLIYNCESLWPYILMISCYNIWRKPMSLTPELLDCDLIDSVNHMLILHTFL